MLVILALRNNGRRTIHSVQCSVQKCVLCLEGSGVIDQDYKPVHTHTKIDLPSVWFEPNRVVSRGRMSQSLNAFEEFSLGANSYLL